MKTKILFSFSLIAALIFAFTSCKKIGVPFCGGDDSTITTIKTFATGLNDPRGLKFGPDGKLYVAEAGVGGTNFVTSCTQVVPPVGPYAGSDSGSRISVINCNGERSTYVDHLPSSITQPDAGSGIQGVADVQFIGNTMYAITAGAGCSHAVPDIPNSIIKINPDRTWTAIANCSEYLMTHPVAHPDPNDFEPDGTPYSMTSTGGNLYITQPNQQEIDKIDPSTGKISRVVDISILHDGSTGGWIGPTSMVYHADNFYFGTLTPFPTVPGAANVYKLSADGSYSVYASGFSAIVGIAFDNHNRLYVLECIGVDSGTPGESDIVRVDENGNREIIASGLDLPTAMTFGPDGKLYVSSWGIGPPGAGEILQIGFKCEEVQGDAKQ